MREQIEGMREWSKTRARPAASRRGATPTQEKGGWMAQYGATRGGLGDKPSEAPVVDDGERKLEL
jgi:hypothetical protein